MSSDNFVVEPVANTYVKDQDGNSVYKVTVYCRSTLTTKPTTLDGRKFALGSWLIETDTSKVYILDSELGWREFK